MSSDLASDLERAASLLRRARFAAALTGAGLSVESGIPPFRGPGGLWDKHGGPTLLSYPEFLRDPAAWWEARLRLEGEPGNPISEIKAAVDQARPNPGHRALAELERLGAVRQVITQNVDGLQQEAGSRNVVELHGNRNWLRCVVCALKQERAGFTLTLLPPRCPACGGSLKLDTVMFGEPVPPPALLQCRETLARCDCLLLVGTSGMVNPAAQFPAVAKERGAALIEVNPHPTPFSPRCVVALSAPAGEALPRLAALLRP